MNESAHFLVMKSFWCLQLAFIIALNISLFKSAKSRLERDCSFENNESSLG